MKRILYVLLLILVILAGYLLLSPTPIDAVAFHPDPIPPLEGDYQANDRLKALSKIHTDKCMQCEDIAIDNEGNIYGGQENGDIIKITKEGTAETIYNTGGRPLGLDFDVHGNLIIADGALGLLRMNPDGQVEVLTTESEGLPFRFTDDVEVGADGIYYFSDASSKWGFEHSTRDLIEHGGHGRLLSYDPNTKKTSTLLSGLQFANGIATASDSSFVLVNETGLFCVRKYWLKGPKKGKDEIILANMPGFPDGISRGSDGIYWLTLVAPRKKDLESIMPKPKLRNIVAKLPKFISEPQPDFYGHVLGITGEGKIVYNFQDKTPNLMMITSVQEVNGQLYMGTLVDNGIGLMTLK
jgi:sugar lactone lactonase YvrE